MNLWKLLKDSVGEMSCHIEGVKQSFQVLKQHIRGLYHTNDCHLEYICNTKIKDNIVM